MARVRRSFLTASLAALLSLAQGCGADPAQDAPGGETPIPPAPNGQGAVTPGGTTNPPAMPPAAPPATGQQGVLWTTIDTCRGENAQGTDRVSLTSGRETTLETEISDVYPVPSGEWYAYQKGKTVGVIETATLQRLWERTLDVRLTRVHAAPHDRKLVQGTIVGADGKRLNMVVVDLSTGQTVHRVSGPRGDDLNITGNELFAWLPDGRYLIVFPSGWREVRKLDGTRETIEMLSFPAGYTIGWGTWVNPAGTEHTLQLIRETADTAATDVWVAPIGAGTLDRVTQTNETHYAIWSPDGKYLAFDVDRIWPCDNLTVAGHLLSAEIFYVPASTRRAVDGTPFEVDGRVDGSWLLGWTAR